MTDPPRPVVVNARKNVGVAMILAILFGPFGLLYATVSGGVVMLVLSLIVVVPTYGVGLFFTWIIGIIWAHRATTRYNAKRATDADRVSR
jgi:hypothetical protein